MNLMTQIVFICDVYNEGLTMNFKILAGSVTTAFFALNANAYDLHVELPEGAFATTKLNEAKITIHYGPLIAAVQPWAEITFKYSSCAERDFKVKTKLVQDNFNNLAISVYQEADAYDCRGPSRERSYSLQVTSDASLIDFYYLVANGNVVELEID